MQAQPPAQLSHAGGRIALGCMTAFALLFVLMGGLAVKQGLAVIRHDSDGWIVIGVGALFAGVGVAVIAASWYGMKHVSQELTMREQYPDRPWLWRDDWPQGYAREAGGTVAVITLWVFAIIWCAISAPLLLVLRRELAHGNPKVLFAAIFPAIGVIFVICAFFVTLRQRRYGRTVCHFDGVPLPIGRTIRGDVELHADINPDNGYVFRLSCVHAVTTGSGKSRSTTETVVWDEESVVSASAAMRSPVGTRVPFELVTPPDAPPTDARNSRDRTFWRLAVCADVPGVDLATSFELPLFVVTGATDGHEYASFAESHRAQAAERAIVAGSGITVEELSEGGERFTVRSHPTFGGFLGSVLFMFVWSGVIYAMIRFQIPIGFPIVFGLFDLLIVYSLFDYLFGRSIVQASRDGVLFRRTLLGGGSMRNISAADIAAITGTADVQNKNFNVTLRLKDGRTRDLARFLRSRADADTVAARLERALGR